MKKVISLLVFFLLLLVPDRIQNVFAFGGDIFEVIEDFVNGQIEYTVINNFVPSGNPNVDDENSVIAFAIEFPDPLFFDPFALTLRQDWQGVLLDNNNWDGTIAPSDGIRITSDTSFGPNGLFTDDLGSFDSLFSGDHRVALFFDGPDLLNPIGPGQSSSDDDFLIINLLPPASDVAIVCNNPAQPLCANFDTNDIDGDGTPNNDDQCPNDPNKTEPGIAGCGNPELQNQVVGGEIIPIEQTSLILAGTQSFSWMIIVMLSTIGIGLFIVRRINLNKL